MKLAKFKSVAKYFCLFAAVLITLFPLYWLVQISLKHRIDQLAVPPIWFTLRITGEHYYDTFIARPFFSYLLNSLIVAFSATLLSLVIGTMAAYSLARMKLPAKLSHHLSLWILSTRMFPPIVSIIPLYLIMRGLSMINTRGALVISYILFNLPFVVWMMRGFFQDIPKELEESAMIDGDSRIGALCRVVLPIAAPGLAATAIFCLIMSWNEFLFALILSQTDDVMTLPVGISRQVTQYEIRWGAMSAAGVVAIIPVLVFAMLVQRYLIRGLSFGAVKG